MKSNLILSSNKLLEKRQQDLNAQKALGLKPFGKHLDNNVFCWFNPNLEGMLQTLSTFPEPVVWLNIGGSLRINEALAQYNEIQFAYHEFSSEKSIWEQIMEYLSKSKQATFLISANGEENREALSEIEHLLISRAYL